MRDFAAAAMMRLIQLGLKRQGLTPPAADTPSAAHVALREKRTLARTLLETHGPVVPPAGTSDTATIVKSNRFQGSRKNDRR